MPSDDLNVDLLPYVQLNEGAKESIIFIHGAFGGGRDWDLVTPHLDNYHLILPDLPGHGSARQIPYSLGESITMIERLITSQAHDNVAHVVGFSLGAKVALGLVSQHPHVAQDRTVLVSGFLVLPQTSLSQYIPHAIWTMTRIEWCLPRSLVSWLMDGTDMPRPDLSKVTLPACRRIFGPPTDGTSPWPCAWPARTLIIAAGKSGILPTADDANIARKLESIGNIMNSDSIAVTHPRLRHPWLRQEPVLFAETIVAWIEHKSLSDEFLMLQ